MSLNIRNRNKGTDKEPSWEYRFEIAKVGGKRKQISKSGFATKKEAEKEGLKALMEYNQSGKIESGSDMSFSDFIDLWERQYVIPNLKESTHHSLMNRVNKHIRPYLGKYKLKALNSVLIQDYINELFLNKEMTESTKKLVKTSLVSILNYAVTPCDFIPSNPSNLCKAPKKSEGGRTVERVIYTEEQMREILSHFDTFSDYYCAIMISYNTGLRIGEVFALVWEDIDLENRTISVRRNVTYISGKNVLTTPKTKKSARTVMFGDALKKYLIKYKTEQKRNEMYYGKYYAQITTNFDVICPSNVKDEDFIMRKENGSYSNYHLLQTRFRIMSKKMEFNVNFHSFRHTHATKLIESGISPKVVQERLGHSDITTTMNRYVHVTEMMQTTAVEIFEKYAL